MKDIVYQSEILRIQVCPACDKTTEHPVYLVLAADNDSIIGQIRWNRMIQEYCLEARPGTAWNWDALFHILNFLIDELNKKILGGP